MDFVANGWGVEVIEFMNKMSCEVLFFMSFQILGSILLLIP